MKHCIAWAIYNTSLGCLNTRVFAMYQLLCWVGKHENIIMKLTNSPNPRPTQPEKKKKVKKSGNRVTFPHSQYFFVGWDWFYTGNRLPRNLTQPNSPQTPYFTGSHSNQDPRCTQKTIYTPIFTHHVKSWLRCTLVNNKYSGVQKEDLDSS